MCGCEGKKGVARDSTLGTVSGLKGEKIGFQRT